jgi:hypothetical protein
MGILPNKATNVAPTQADVIFCKTDGDGAASVDWARKLTVMDDIGLLSSFSTMV